VAVVIALVAGSLALAGVFTKREIAGSSTTWTAFHEKAGLYTLRYPSSWKVQTRSFTLYGDSYTEIVTVRDPTPGSKSGAYILAGLLTANAALHSFYCNDAAHTQHFRPFPPKNFSGISAFSLESSTWQFDTTSAHFEIGGMLPSGQNVPYRNLNPTGPPQDQSDQPDLSLLGANVNGILNSIHIANTSLLAC
jgi:hypothetical protein